MGDPHGTTLVHVKTPDGREIRYSSEARKPLTKGDAARETKKHRDAVRSMTDPEKKFLDRVYRQVFHRGRPTIQQLTRIGLFRGMRAGGPRICPPLILRGGQE